MTDRRAGRLRMAVAVACLGCVPGVARAQFGAGTYGATPGGSVNPYANPVMNPFMNPYMAQMTGSNTTAGNAALYFVAAQQMTGGLGSGQLSGVRPQRGASTSAAATPARVAPEGSSMVPGGTAARYFDRSTRTDMGLSRYYNNQGRYYPKKGR